MHNGLIEEASNQVLKEKSQYKLHKRKTRNKLIFLVGLHVFLIFCFCILTSVELLTEPKSQQVIQISSIGTYLAYFILVLFSVKYKIRYLMILSISALVVCAGLKIQLCVFQSLENHKLSLIYTLDVIFILFNCIVPWRFLILWDQLKQKKWRETFDFRFKLNNHLLDEQNNSQN